MMKRLGSNNLFGRLIRCSIAAAAVSSCGTLTAAQASAQAAAVASADVPTGPGSLSGVWANSDYNREAPYQPRLQELRTADGQPPPLQPWAAELLEKRVEGSEAGHTFVSALSQCFPSGVPAMMFYPGLPIQILETTGQVTFLNEEMTYFRIIRLNADHRPDPDPGFKGDSVGHWEGDTLVVDTIGLSEKTTLDSAGTPHSEDLHVVERYRRVSRDTIELLVTLDDPKTFTRPWTAKTHFKPAGRGIEEYICENNRNKPTDGHVGMQLPSSSH